MARRKKKAGDLGDLVGVVIILIVGAGILQHGKDLSILLVVIVAAVVLFFLYRSRVKRALLERVNAAVSVHIEALSRRRAQLVQTDAYGVPQLNRWTKEIDYFLQQQVVPGLPAGQVKMLQSQRSTVFAEIERRVVAASAAEQPLAQFSDDLTPAEYEAFCAQVLRQHGWDARVTKQSRDQGVDVVASRDGLRVVVQCKLYNAPVGNKAVQEVSAGRAHEQADYGVVVSNNRYTSSAVALAKTNRILLLHHRDLPNLQPIIERAATSPAA